MALAHLQFFSAALNMQSSVDVILPEAVQGIGQVGSAFSGKLPTLYLLHGLSDDHTIWQRRTSIERYVAGLPLCVVMPAVGRSFYTDMKYGQNYWTYVSEELPRVMGTYFPLSERREDTFVAGLSMGGYGALKLALRCPERYAAAASLSGAVNMVTRYREMRDERRIPETELYSIFGTPEEMEGSDNDLNHLFDEMLKTPQRCPQLFVCCGTEDFLIRDNRALRDHYGKALSIAYHEESGVHEWAFWDRWIQQVLAWLPIRRA